MHKIAAGSILLLSLASGPVAFAEDLKNVISDAAASGNLGKGFQTIAVLGATPGVSRTELTGDALDVRTHKLRIPHRFSRWDEAGNLHVSPYVEATLGGAKATETIAFQGGRPDDFRLDLGYRSRSLLVGIGAAVPVGNTTQLKPMILAGHTSLDIDSDYQGQDAALFAQIYDGLLIDAGIDTSFVGAAVQLDHGSTVLGDGRINASARYSHYLDVTEKVTSPGLKPRGTTGVATFSVLAEKPTKIYVGERELFAGVFARGNALFGKGRDLFGFNRFVEIGGTLKLDYPVDKGLGFGVASSILRGPGVKGYSLALLVRFAGVDLLTLGQ